MEHPASLDLTCLIRLGPSISRTFWSTERAWPGATVRIHVETRHVPDGTAIAIEIRSSDPEVTTALHTIEAVIEDSRCIAEHTIDWDHAALDSVLAATTSCAFCFTTTIETYALAAISAPLYVPFEPFTP